MLNYNLIYNSLIIRLFSNELRYTFKLTYKQIVVKKSEETNLSERNLYACTKIKIYFWWKLFDLT